MRNLFLALSLFVLAASPARATPTLEQRAWFDQLSPEEADVAMQALEDRQLMARWDTVTRFGVRDLVRTPDIVRLNPTAVVPWPAFTRKDEKIKVWWSVETPRHATTPVDVRVEWENGGTVIQMKTFAIDHPSPKYRLWDTITLRRRGVWKVRILLGNTVLAQNEFTVD